MIGEVVEELGEVMTAAAKAVGPDDAGRAVGSWLSRAGTWFSRALNLNNNAAKSRFGVYEIRVVGRLFKVGRADLIRITNSSGLPTRLHHQIRD